MRSLWLILTAVTLLAGSGRAGEQINFKAGDRVVFIGNTFAERLSKAGYFETALTARYADLKLSFRNLGWSADTLSIQLRPLNFGDLHTHLHDKKADVIIACYGMAESFEGVSALPQFEKDLESFLKLHRGMDYSGKGAPRIVLVSPIAHENLGGDFIDPTQHNEELKAYTEAMRKVATAMNFPFIDLFTPTQQLMAAAKATKLTINGIHLNDYGNWVVAQLMMEQLGMLTPPTIEINAQAGTATAVGAEAGEFKKAGPRLSVAIKPAALPLPPPPRYAQPHDRLLQHLPLLTVKGLAAGAYELRVGGVEIAKTDAATLEKGIRLAVAPGADAAEQLRLQIDDKNWHFFMKYRAVNGEYIYGRRKEPFGVKSFPAEFELLDKMIGEQEGKILQSAKPAAATSIEVVRADGKE